MVKGYERMCFEQDLEPIIKQSQEVREISPNPVSTSATFSIKATMVPNPEIIEVKQRISPSNQFRFNYTNNPTVSKTALANLIVNDKPSRVSP